MLEAASLATILEALNRSLPRARKGGYGGMAGPLDVFGDVRSGRPQQVSVAEGSSKLVGLLFCHPKSELAKSEILGHLQYFHVRSGRAVDFFCAGFGAYWPASDCADQVVVAKVEGVEWLYSERAFNALRAEVASNTTWKFSGETDLLLLAARRRGGQAEAALDFGCAIACNLEAMKKDAAFSSVRAFFESIIDFSERYSGNDIVARLSDQFGMKEGGKFLLEAILLLLPEKLRAAYKSARHFAIRDISAGAS